MRKGNVSTLNASSGARHSNRKNDPISFLGVLPREVREFGCLKAMLKREPPPVQQFLAELPWSQTHSVTHYEDSPDG